jgi:nicotinamide-nucleotide amidase
MRCEVVAVGTELLLGQIVDTNSSWLGEQLALAGIDSHFQTKVGDNLERIIEAFKIALGRSDAVIACGGLGPTQDDITRDAIARLTGAELKRDPLIAERIRAMFTARGRTMPDNNLRQADVPVGAKVIAQMPGTAPGLICPIGEKVIYAVPGVPSEMREMVRGTVIPDLQRRSGSVAVIKSRTLRTWGQSESGLAEMLAERITALDAAGNPTIAFLASGIEGIKVRITAKGASSTAAQAMIDGEEAQIRSVLGDLVFGVDEETIEHSALRLLRQRGWTLAAAEWITGGLLAARLSAAQNAEEIFRGALVAGTHSAVPDLLKGAVAPADAESLSRTMAEAARRTFAADVGVAATLEQQPAGERQSAGVVHLALAIKDTMHTQAVKLPRDPERMRQFTVIGLMNFLRLKLQDN